MSNNHCTQQKNKSINIPDSNQLYRINLTKKAFYIDFLSCATGDIYVSLVEQFIVRSCFSTEN